MIDPFGQALDGRPILRGAEPRPLRGVPMNPTERRVLGARLETGMAVFNTLLPLVRGQRIGLVRRALAWANPPCSPSSRAGCMRMSS